MKNLAANLAVLLSQLAEDEATIGRLVKSTGLTRDERLSLRIAQRAMREAARYLVEHCEERRPR